VKVTRLSSYLGSHIMSGFRSLWMTAVIQEEVPKSFTKDMRR